MATSLQIRSSALLTPQLASEQLHILQASIFPQISKSEEVQLWALMSIFALLSAVYIFLAASSIYRWMKGSETLWLFRGVRPL